MRRRLVIVIAGLLVVLGLAFANRQRLPWWLAGDGAAGQRSGFSGGSGPSSAAGPFVRVTSMQLRGGTNHPPTNVIARLMREEQEGGDVDRGAWHRGVETYVQQHNRSAESLLAAARVLRGLDRREYLREAKEKYPNDPRVAYAAFYQPPFDNRQAAPEERRQWLDAFQQAAPDNALPGYLSARDDFKAGRTDQAVQEVLAAVGKPIQDYALESIQNVEQAYLAAGLPEAEATARATGEQPLPQLAELKQLTINLVEYAKTQQSGDPAAAQSALQAAVRLGGQLDSDGPFLINNLVGIAVQQIALNAMDPAATLGDAGQTVQSQLDALNQHKQDLKAVAQQIEAVLPYLTDQEVVAYFDRIRRDGETAAVQWLLSVPAHP
ncbi:MAG: hypothetical protein ABSC03_13035 [Verrucomicrobiota bacterium]|jgi:hypothetical protein